MLEDSVFSGLGFVVGIIINALYSSNIQKNRKSVITTLCYIVWIFAYIYYFWPESGEKTGKELFSFITLLSNFWQILTITFICWIVTLYLIIGSNTVNRRRISQFLIKETAKASTEKELRIIAGDLDFLGDLTKKNITAFRAFILSILNLVPILRNTTYVLLNDYIEHNEQWKQLSENEFRKIQIICRKPSTKKDILMIGFIKQNRSNVEIKFHGEVHLKCANCTNKEKCEVCDTCKSCSINSTCDHNSASCEELLKSKNMLCKFPDLKIRGRLFINREDSLRVNIFTKTEDKHKYVNNLFTANAFEASFYDNLWLTWWQSCREESDYLENCTQKYREYIKSGRNIESVNII